MPLPDARISGPVTWYDHSGDHGQQMEPEYVWSPLDVRTKRPMPAFTNTVQRVQLNDPSEYPLSRYPSSEHLTALPQAAVTDAPSEGAVEYIVGRKLVLLLLG